MQGLESDGAVMPDVMGTIDYGHSAARDFGLDTIMSCNNRRHFALIMLLA
jgi:hypothetical protein